MRPISEQRALKRLARISDDYRKLIAERYEHLAASCASCKTPGACCLDEHFVNVNISRLEAAAIRDIIKSFPEAKRVAINERIRKAIENYGLDVPASEKFSQTYACPLYEKGLGCVVHFSGKPVACITHACYESPSDMPPDEVQFEQERRIDRLNDLTYGKAHIQKPIPLAIAERC